MPARKPRRAAEKPAESLANLITEIGQIACRCDMMRRYICSLHKPLNALAASVRDLEWRAVESEKFRLDHFRMHPVCKQLYTDWKAGEAFRHALSARLAVTSPDGQAELDLIDTIIASEAAARKAYLSRDREWSNRLRSQDTIHPGSPDFDLAVAWYVAQKRRTGRRGRRR